MASPSSGQLPNGIDWADGQLGRVGTLTTAGVIQIQSSAGVGAIPIEEVPGYPTIECGEQATIVHKFTMSWAEALTQILFYQRGTILADDEGNVTRVLTSSISRTRGGPDPFQTWAEMTITCEAISFDTPPDLFRVTEVELGINIIKYPRYFYGIQYSYVGEYGNG